MIYFFTKIKNLINRSVIFLIVSVVAFLATGYSASADLPGDETLPSTQKELKKWMAYENGKYRYSVEDFIKAPKQSDFLLSPNGKFISYVERRNDGKKQIVIKNTGTGKSTVLLKEKDQLINEYRWVSAQYIVFSMDRGGDENYRLFSLNIKNGKQKQLTPDGVRTGISDEKSAQENHLLIAMNKDNPEIFELYDIDIGSGAFVKLYEYDSKDGLFIDEYYLADGKVKGFTKNYGLDVGIFYRESADRDFREIKRIRWSDKFSWLGFNQATKNPHDAYFLSNLDNDTAEVVLYDLKKNKIRKKIYAHDVFDVGGIKISGKRNGEIDTVFYYGEKPEIIPFSPTYKKLHEKFTRFFEGRTYTVASQTDNEDFYLIKVHTYKITGIYYLYDVGKDSFKEIFRLKSHLKEQYMGSKQAITFKSRDGLTIQGYLALPANTGTNKKHPMIVMVHGGPHGHRDDIDDQKEWLQLFSSRGYAVLQVNYRGSGGYGKKFKTAGYKQVGRKMLDDLEDGVKYAIGLGIIDKKKVAVFGGSYGGLATLGSLVRNKGIFVAGVDYVGVSNLFTFYDSFPPYWKPLLPQVYAQWYDPNNKEERQIMKDVSPALNADRISVPLAVLQGANDPRVAISEADQMVKILRKKGFEVPYMVKYDEGHGFRREENNIEAVKFILGFLAKHVK